MSGQVYTAAAVCCDIADGAGNLSFTVKGGFLIARTGSKTMGSNWMISSNEMDVFPVDSRYNQIAGLCVQGSKYIRVKHRVIGFHRNVRERSYTDSQDVILPPLSWDRPQYGW